MTVPVFARLVGAAREVSARFSVLSPPGLARLSSAFLPLLVRVSSVGWVGEVRGTGYVALSFLASSERQRAATPRRSTKKAAKGAISSSAGGADFDEVTFTAYSWWLLSAFPRERGIAARRFRELAPAFVDDRAVFLAIMELAADRHLSNCPRCQRLHAGYHAILITEQVIRDRYGRISEVLREIDKAEEDALPFEPTRPDRGLRSIADITRDVMPKFGARGKGSE